MLLSNFRATHIFCNNTFLTIIASTLYFCYVVCSLIIFSIFKVFFFSTHSFRGFLFSTFYKFSTFSYYCFVTFICSLPLQYCLELNDLYVRFYGSLCFYIQSLNSALICNPYIITERHFRYHSYNISH